MRKKKSYQGATRRIFRPELTHCLECGRRLRRAATVSQRHVVTFAETVQVIHCAYRCPEPDCSGHKRLYRSAQADGLALPGFTFGLDILLWVGKLRLAEHRTVDEIHQSLSQRLAPLGQTIARREILFLFEAYTALLRAGTEVGADDAWREQVRENGGMLLSLDGIQPDKGNETIYLVREVLTGRLLTAENITESTKQSVKDVLAPVVALGLPVLGVISDAFESQLQAVAELWPGTPHQICQFHAIREAGRLIYVLDHRIKTDMRIRLQEKTHTYRQDLHRRMRTAAAQEGSQLAVLETYAATVEGALNIDGITPFKYGGLAMQEALDQIHTSLAQVEKKGRLSLRSVRSD